MSNTNQNTKKKKGGKLIPALCNIAGTLILILVIASTLPMVVPRFLGYDLYEVTSGSMEPEIPMGSVVYTKPVEPQNISPENIITFRTEDAIVTHRVLKNQAVEGKISTKGDANNVEDLNPVAYEDVIGRVEYHVPYVGHLMFLYSSTIGKLYVLLFAACGVMLNMVAGIMRSRRRSSQLDVRGILDQISDPDR